MSPNKKTALHPKCGTINAGRSEATSTPNCHPSATTDVAFARISFDHVSVTMAIPIPNSPPTPIPTKKAKN